MKQLLYALLIALSVMNITSNSCTCMGRLTRNSPAFFIEEYEHECELTENIETEHEIAQEINAEEQS